MNRTELLKKLQDLANEGLLKEQFITAFKAVLAYNTQVEEQMVKRIDERVTQAQNTLKNGVDGKDGKNGKDGRDGKDGKDGKQGERGPAGLQGVQGVQGADGKDGKDGSPDTADDIRNKLELLPEGEKLKIEAIEDLRKELDELKKNASRGTGVIVQSRGQIKLYDLSDQLDGNTKTFSLPTFWRVLTVQSTSTPNAFRPTIDYTTDASAMTITFTSEIDAASTLAAGQTLTVLYAEP